MFSPKSEWNTPVSPPIMLNIDDAIERMGDKEIYIEVAHFFASHLQQSLKELSQALNNNEAAKATRLAHSLKGNCATVGADELRDLCLSMERLCKAEDLEKAHRLYEDLSSRLLALREVLMAL